MVPDGTSSRCQKFVRFVNEVMHHQIKQSFLLCYITVCQCGSYSSASSIRDRKLKQLAGEKAKAREVVGLSVGNDDKFLEASAATIAKHVNNGNWKAKDVVSAYSRQALAQDEKFNFITECLITEAIKQAEQMDEQISYSGRASGSLCGVPMSIKDQFNIENRDSSTGMSKFCDLPAISDAIIVEILKDSGAIILFKTNVPQTMNTNECSNPIFGITRNPTNIDYTCGGSSGGEGASLSSNSSALGIGSDIAGSLRYPVHFCGGYCLKPSEGRWPIRGMFELSDTSESPSISAISGPMGRSVADVALLTHAVLDAEPWTKDASCLNIPWRIMKDSIDKKYHFAFYLEDTYTKTSPACTRAVVEAIEALESAGHRCTKIVPPLVNESAKVFVALTSMDGNRSMRKLLKNDPWEANIAMEMYFPPLPRWIRRISAWLIQKWYNDTQFPALFDVCGQKSAEELCEYTHQRNEIKQHWLEKVWSQKFDGIICPVYPLPAVKHQQTREILPIAVSTFLYNLLDYAVGVVPVTRVDAEVDSHMAMEDYQGWKGVFHNIIYNGMFGEPPIYNANEMTGLNVGVQVVGRHLEEEKVLAMMQVLDEALKSRS
ncbi:putative Acetamidase [Taphrina deformans PYCC 5710]|uniref:amidase n=1 Tax=Taphrina deformans (strain PYCC 5710 / ATCC 11124 / CBS 356.35 / IMI 108563 / JCM 9778 / NBRC 8474) TaxID=1097556 RepID=R4X6R3_TAPDE|nr:putative Acetamidase [Taphrina deformans PYCC 5710]|eukprot:CCG80606.1 putative Acetamidase [Taphrina deformans PYCC 5710]